MASNFLRKMSEESEEDDVDEDGEEDDLASGSGEIKKHPLGHGFGFVGDDYGKFKQGRPGTSLGFLKVANILNGFPGSGFGGPGGPNNRFKNKRQQHHKKHKGKGKKKNKKKVI